jgi:hypothetical protein
LSPATSRSASESAVLGLLAAKAPAV